MKSKICILSGRYPKSSFTSHINHKAYTQKHGYTYINCNWPTPAKNLYFNKMYYILEYIENFDYIFWIDDDAFFMNLEKSIEAFLPKEDQILTACKSPTNKNIHTFLSSGQLGIKGGYESKQFIELVINTRLDEVSKWWKTELGFFTNGDQDAIIYNLVNEPKYKDKYKLYDYNAFNSRLPDLLDSHSEVFILHFTGTRKIKFIDYKHAQKHLNRGKSLLPKHYESKLNVISEDKKQPNPIKILKKFFKRLPYIKA